MSIPPGADLTQIPMALNPSGAPPDFEHGPNLVGAVQGVGGTLAFISLVLIIIRLRVYIPANRGLVWDDVFLLLSWAMAFMYTVVASTLGRLCRHTWDTPVSEVNPDYMKKLVTTSIVVGPMNFFAKAAILMLYYRLFHAEVWMRRACWILGIFFIGAYWQTVPQNFVFCMPRPGKPWDASVLANCTNLKIPGLVHGAINCFADIIMVLLPLPIIMKLHISTSKKIAISGIFASGLLALICSVLGIYYRVMISYGNDPVWSNAQCWIVVQGEVYVAICVACAPSLAKVWKIDFKTTRFYKTLMSILTSARSSEKGSYPSAQGRKSPSDSSSALNRNQPYNIGVAPALPAPVRKPSLSFNSAHAGYEMMHETPKTSGVHREVRIDVTSHSCRDDMV